MGTEQRRQAVIAASQRERAEQFTNGIYGTILVTAFLGAVDGLTHDAVEVFGELVATSVVVFVAHTYASLLGSGVAELGHWRSHMQATVMNQVPLIAVVAVPAGLLALAALEIMSLSTAIAISIGFGLLGLFSLSYLVAAERGHSKLVSLGSGLLGAMLGLGVVGLEASLH